MDVERGRTLEGRKGVVHMRRFKGLYLKRGNNKFNFGHVKLDIGKTIGNPNWEITIKTDDICGIYKALDKNQTFMLHAEWTSKSHGVTVFESVSGELVITEIDPNKKSLYGVSPNLKVSGVPDNERVKVQFD